MAGLVMRAPVEIVKIFKIVEMAENSTESVDLDEDHDERERERDVKLTHSVRLSCRSCKVNCFIVELSEDWSSSQLSVPSLTALHCYTMDCVMLGLAGTGQPYCTIRITT